MLERHLGPYRLPRGDSMTYSVAVRSGVWEVRADTCAVGFVVEVLEGRSKRGSWTVTREKEGRVRQMLHGLADDAVKGKRRTTRAILAALERLLGDRGTDSTIS